MRRALGLLLALLLGGASASAPACGDKVLLVARNIRYEKAFAATIPAAVLIAAQPGSALAAMSSAVEKVLRAAGHRPRTVEGAEALDAALRSGAYDLVLADAARLAEAVAGVKGAGSSAEVLPVVTEADVAADPAGYACVVKAARRTSFLSVVNEAMAARKKGEKVSCRKA